MKTATLVLDVNIADTLLAATFAELAKWVASTIIDLELTTRTVATAYDGHQVTCTISGT